MSPPACLYADVRYEIVRLISEGGMGVVYEAKQIGAHGFVKRVAVKRIRDRFSSEPGFVENFVGEARLVADLIHSNIVQTYHLGEAQGTCFISMELIRGVNVEQLLTRLRHLGRVMEPAMAVFLVSRVVRGLAYAHAKTAADGSSLGIVHRDVNPRNILVAFEGDVKLSDFGIAKARGFLRHREGEEVAGKPEYMSPEQADFQVTDRRSDLFSVGIVLSELLLGRNIFRCETPEASRACILGAHVPDHRVLIPDLPERIGAILQRALAREVEDRYQTADALLYDLEYCIYHGGYGPTNETMGQYLKGLFPELAAPAGPATGGAGAVEGANTVRLPWTESASGREPGGDGAKE